MFEIKLRPLGNGEKWVAETPYFCVDTWGSHAIIEKTKEQALSKLLEDLACFIGVESKEQVKYKLIT